MHSQLNRAGLLYPPRGTVQSNATWPGICAATMHCRDPPCGVLHKTRLLHRVDVVSRQIKAQEPCRLWTVVAGESCGVETIRGSV